MKALLTESSCEIFLYRSSTWALKILKWASLKLTLYFQISKISHLIESNSFLTCLSLRGWRSRRSPRPAFLPPRFPPRWTSGAAVKLTSCTRAARPFFSRSFLSWIRLMSEIILIHYFVIYSSCSRQFFMNRTFESNIWFEFLLRSRAFTASTGNFSKEEQNLTNNTNLEQNLRNSKNLQRPLISENFNANLRPLQILILLYKFIGTFWVVAAVWLCVLALGLLRTDFFCLRYSSRVIVLGSSGSGAAGGASSFFSASSLATSSATGSVWAFNSSSGVPQLPAPAPSRLSLP